MTVEQIGTLVNSGGVVVLLVAALYGGFKGFWVYGRTFTDMVADRDRWRDIALHAVPLADKAVAVVEVAVKKNGIS